MMTEDEKRIRRIELLVAEFPNLDGHPLDNAFRLISSLKIPVLTYEFESCPKYPDDPTELWSAKAKELPLNFLECDDGTIEWVETVGYGDTREEAKLSLDDLISKHCSVIRKMASKGKFQSINLKEFDAEHGLIEKMTFSAQILYNVGLGPQFYDIPHIEALNPDDAKTEAGEIADKKLGNGKWLEVRVKPIIP